MRATYGAFVILLALAGLASAQNASKVGGHWEGKIAIPDHELSIAIDLAPAAEGAWIGSMSVVGTSSIDVPLAALAVDGGAVKFVANLPEKATFAGKLSVDGATLSGTAANAQGEAPFSVSRSGEAKVKVPAPSSPLTKDFEGAWDGSLTAGGNQVQVGMKLVRGADGLAVATLISHGTMEIPAATVTLRGKDLRLEIPAVSASYQGTLNDGGEITGELTQGGEKLALTFKRASK